VKVSGANGSGVGTSRPGVYVAGCASGPKNIRESIEAAKLAAGSALAELDPRQLGEEGTATEAGAKVATGPVPPDEMRAKIEQLLYALIGQSNG